VIIAIIGVATSNGNTTTTTPLNTGQFFAGFFTLFVLITIPFGVYYGLMNGSKRGQTLGKMIFNIAVRDATTGGPIGFWRAFGRYLMMQLFYVLLIIPYVLDNLSPLWDMRRQAWHDHIVRSVVVDRSP